MTITTFGVNDAMRYYLSMIQSFVDKNTERLENLLIPPGNRLETLKGDRAGQHSIRINDQYRICFEWTEKGPMNVEICDYH